MNSKNMIVKVNNVTEGSSKNVVVRVVDGECWYYGRYETQEKADDVAKEIDGLVVHDEEHIAELEGE